MPDQRDEEIQEHTSSEESSMEPTRLATDPSDEPTPPRTIPVDGDEDDETWTNQPAKGAVADPEAADEDLLDDEDEEEQDAQPVTRKVIQNGRDVLCEELPNRASRAKLRLKPHLTCTLAVELSSSGERFIFDWKGEEPTVAPATGPVTVNGESPGEAMVVDCIISLTEQNLMAVRSGDLNPQVAMLADKIKVKGKVGPAVYLFNLIAPRFQQ
ncbi:MAG: sterol transfer family [Pseudomonadota bacterium]|jgi:hypothetical protein